MPELGGIEKLEFIATSGGSNDASGHIVQQLDGGPSTGLGQAIALHDRAAEHHSQEVLDLRSKGSTTRQDGTDLCEGRGKG